MKKARFRLILLLVNLDTSQKIMQEFRENDCLLEVYSYFLTIPQVELIKFLICIIQRESKPNQEG